MGHGPAPDGEILQGFEVTGQFLRNHLAPQLGNRPLPEARARYVARFAAEVARG
jgi:DNA repair protein RecO (recombination protein O)